LKPARALRNSENDATAYSSLTRFADLLSATGLSGVAKVSFRSYYLDGFMGYCSIEDSKNENM